MPLDDPKLLGSLIVAGCLISAFAIVVLSVWASRRAADRRTSELMKVAPDLDLSFLFDTPAEPLRNRLARSGQLPLLARGRNGRIENVMVGTRDAPVAVFDYTYVVGSGKTQHNRTQSVVAYDLSPDPLPCFELRPRFVWHWLTDGFRGPRITFTTHAAFGRRYRLRGEAQEAIRNAFSDGALQGFEDLRGLSVESGGGWLIVYRFDRLVRPGALPALLGEADKVLALLRPSSGSRKADR